MLRGSLLLTLAAVWFAVTFSLTFTEQWRRSEERLHADRTMHKTCMDSGWRRDVGSKHAKTCDEAAEGVRYWPPLVALQQTWRSFGPCQMLFGRECLDAFVFVTSSSVGAFLGLAVIFVLVAVVLIFAMQVPGLLASAAYQLRWALGMPVAAASVGSCAVGAGADPFCRGGGGGGGGDRAPSLRQKLAAPLPEPALLRQKAD